METDKLNLETGFENVTLFKKDYKDYDLDDKEYY